MAEKKPVIMIYIMLIFFAVSLAFLLNIYFQVNKGAYYIYLFLRLYLPLIMHIHWPGALDKVLAQVVLL